MAENIAFIIGNGFDLSLGLRTSYKEFYKYAKSKKSGSLNKIYSAINDDPQTWADFELALGTYTQFIEDMPPQDRLRESKALHNDLEEVINDLADYLELQEPLAQGREISLTRNGFFDGLPDGQRARVEPHVASGVLGFRFITLNYTRTLENVLPHQNIVHIPENIMVDHIHHIHGDVANNVTLGVSDESQISDALEGDEKDDLIKPSLITSMNDGRIEVMQTLLQTSMIVVLFGTSIGETDEYIWQYLIQWLSGNPNRLIIIHKHDSTYNSSIERLQRRKKLFIGEVQNRLLNNMDLDNDVKVSLRNRIFVIHNSTRIFKQKKRQAR